MISSTGFSCVMAQILNRVCKQQKTDHETTSGMCAALNLAKLWWIKNTASKIYDQHFTNFYKKNITNNYFNGQMF